jgi:ADP-ribose pyrophosphatase
MNVFLAEEPTEGNATPMEDERIESRWFSMHELEESVVKGTIEDGKTIAACAAYKWRRKRTAKRTEPRPPGSSKSRVRLRGE